MSEKPVEKKEDVVEEEECTATFEPVIKLEVKEQEALPYDVVFEAQGVKLMRYAAETKEWKERGNGVLKIWRHKETKYSSVVLIREGVMKLACNHFVLSSIQIKKNPKNDKIIMYSVGQDLAQDYEGKPAHAELFTFKFVESEDCAKFCEKFAEEQKHNDELIKAKSN